MYKSKKNSVYYNDEFICSVSPPDREIDETLLEGESWMSMYDRTKPQRERNKAVENEMAKYIADSLNIAYT